MIFPLHTIKAYSKSRVFVSVLTYWGCLDFIFMVDIKYFDKIKIFTVQVIAPEGKSGLLILRAKVCLSCPRPIHNTPTPHKPW